MENLRNLLKRSADNYGSRIAFTLKEEEGKYKDISYIRYFEEVKCLGEALLYKGINKDKVAIIGKNSYNWFLANAATQISGNVSVPLDKELKYEEFEQCLIRSEAKVIFYDRKERDMVLKAMAAKKTKIKHAFPLFECDEENISNLLLKGKNRIDNLEDSIDKVEIDDDEVSFLLFTSGTTSVSKIVMLSQRNIYTNVYNMLDVEPIYATDTNMALLPYHHTFGSTGQWVMLGAGNRTVYCDGLKYIQKNMQEYGVSLFVGVPLIIESMYNKIIKTAEKQGAVNKLKRFQKLVRGLKKFNLDIRRNIFKGVIDALGGKLRLVILGASAADPECIRGLYDFGVLAIQGYGLTETSPVLAAEREHYRKPGSVGIPMQGVEIKIDNPDEYGIGEIVARGDNIMKGYYMDDEATNQVLKDGWFYTGDLGYLDKDGFLFLTGRKKNVIVLKNGKNVSPEEIEAKISKLPYVVENIVFGIPNKEDERDLVIATKIVYDEEKLTGKSQEEILEIINKDIDKINEEVPLYRHIKRIYFTDRPMVKTSTGKIKKYIEIKNIKESLKQNLS